MSTAEVLSAQSRGTVIKNPSALRREAMILGIVYGNKKDPEMIAIDLKILTKAHQSSKFLVKFLLCKSMVNLNKLLQRGSASSCNGCTDSC